ncbi:4-hydroxybutyrate dehydrogenase [Feifania hominis]|uniref:4-hydroxybutyrate dehydrogenase n=1 Tax=Feifania hominis TaxID=2763660 RepID=A0A926DEJ0_9FIRM|nr:4-hydroxybutyrate dehydrogenase [Feifania hominis]MBC8536349.1 4-hydroxybutyrate dehydrogenase [Feifania hominis]
MRQFLLKTEIHKFAHFDEFAREFSLGEHDLILTQEFIYKPFMEKLKLPCQVVFQEKYGAGEPTDEMTDAIARDVSARRYDRVIAVGGGTVIDIAKVLALKPFEHLTELFDDPARIVKQKELIIVPTTCGTGSEVTNVSIFALLSRHTKMGIANPELTPDYAVLIPELISTLPMKFFLYSSIDALVHSVESYLSPRASVYNEMFAERSIDIILKAYQRLLAEGEGIRPEIEEDVLIASNFGGISFGNSGTGAVHAMSYPLGGTYHVAHGESNYQFFCAVLKRYEQKHDAGKLVALKERLSGLLGCAPGEAFDQLDALLGRLIEKHKLRDYGMKPEEIERFAKSVIEGQQRLLVNNFVPLSEEEIADIYRKLY